METPTEPEDVWAPLDDIFERANQASAHIRHIDKLLLLVAEDDDEGTKLGEALYSLDVLRRRLKETYETLEDLITQRVKEELTLGNGATIEVKGGAPRKGWNHQGLTEEVSRRIVDSAFDFDTGEMKISLYDLAKEILRYAAPSYWRVGQLGEIGIDPDQYCEKGEYRKSVVIRRPNE